MRKQIIFLAFLLFVPALAAHALVQGEAIPLTNTRYGVIGAGTAVFVSNGSDTFFLWDNSGVLRLTKMIEGERRVGRPIATANGGGFDVAWNGTYFVTVFGALDEISGREVRGQVLDRNGEPVGGAFSIAQGTAPKLLRSGNRTFVLYRSHRLSGPGGLAVLELSATGQPVSSERLLTEETPHSFAVAGNDDGIGIAVASNRGVRFLLADRSVQVLTERVIEPPTPDIVPPTVTIATNGDGYLVGWVSPAPLHAFAATVSADGVPGRTLFLSDEVLQPVLALWSGSDYVVTYLRQDQPAAAHIDPETETIASTETFPVGRTFSVAGGWTADGRTRIALSTLRDGLELVEVGGGEAVAIGYAAASQTPFVTVPGPSSTLVVWSEDLDGERTTHAGIRRNDGTWIEQPLTTLELLGDDSIAGAAHGEEFMLLVSATRPGGSTVTAYRINSGARIAASKAITALTPTAIVASGNDFVVAGFANNRMVTARLARDGTVTGLVEVPYGNRPDISDIAIATNGNGFLLTWDEFFLDLFPPGGVYHSVYTLTLGADRQPAQTPVRIFEYEADALPVPAPYWDGTRYLVAFSDATHLYRARINANGSLAGVTRIREGRPNTDYFQIRVLPLGTNVAVTWIQSDPESGLLSRHLVALPPSGSGSSHFELPLSSLIDSLQSGVFTLPDGRAGIIAPETTLDAPHHGARRLLLTMLSEAPLPVRPAAPRAIARRINGQIQVDWEAVDGPVHGYRVEYRIADGSWNEITRWHDPDELVTRWIAGRAGVTYALRVRAFNDAGPGEYSEPAVIYIGKRRSAR
ncbi:MAG TPA: fibronectin type III domain-containing protein [Thermoanaerobaculia bacterium]|nr:fibronectin type III domain-containing protein [Thermoanaerobaculia bacterium]